MENLKKHHRRNTIEYEVSGDYALFSDPVLSTGGEKTSLPIPTYQALKEITKSIYWKPTITWYVDAVRIINPIQMETKGMIVPKFKGGNDLASYTYLKDVRYQVRAHFEFNKNHGELACDWEENKHYQIAKRMVEAGGRRDIFLGCRECAGDVEPCTFGSGESYYDSLTKKVSYGFMYHGKTYADEAVLEEEKDKLTVNFWHPVMEPGGIIRFIRPEKCQKRMVHDMDIKIWHHTDLLLCFYLPNYKALPYSWNELQTGYNLNLTDKHNIEKIKEFIHFYQEHISLLGEKKQEFYTLLHILLGDNLSRGMQVFREKEFLVKELFSVDAKSYLLDHQNTFSKEQWNILISDDYITIQELYEASPYWTIGYIKPLNTPEKRSFFKNFCEDRNWLFTETDVERLQSLFNNSWLPGIAFYEKSLGIPDMPVEELRELIDYACELFFRIPYICNLEHFIAGCITNPAVKNAIGTEICDLWYQLLLDRGYQTIEAVQKEYLSKEAYEEILRRKKQLEEEEKLRIEQESVKKQTAEWIEELQLMQKTVDKFILIKNHFPSLFYYGTRVQALACLELLKQVPDGGMLKEELVEPYYSFFVQCYVNELITKEQMLHYMEIFTK